MFIGEQPDCVTGIESRHVDFHKEDFPTKGEVSRELELYEIEATEDPVDGVPSSLVNNKHEIILSQKHGVTCLILD